MNKFVGLGRITAKPELQYTPSQMAVTKFTIAVDRHTKEGGADFIRVTAFGRQAENICRYMDKGRQIAVEGKITTGSYKNKEGKTIYTTDVVIDRSEFIGNKATSQQVSSEQVREEVTDLFGNDFNYVDESVPF